MARKTPAEPIGPPKPITRYVPPGSEARAEFPPYINPPGHWSPAWREQVAELAREKGRTLCGCPKGNGLPCAGGPMNNGRCSVHGGKTPVGVASPQWKHGERSRLRRVPERYERVFAESLARQDLLSLAPDLAELEAIIDEVNGEIDECQRELFGMSDTGGLSLKEAMRSALADAMDAFIDGNQERTKNGLQRLAMIVEDKPEEGPIRKRLATAEEKRERLEERRRRLVDTERRRKRDEARYVDSTQLAAFVGSLTFMHRTLIPSFFASHFPDVPVPEWIETMAEEEVRRELMRLVIGLTGYGNRLTSDGGRNPQWIPSASMFLCGKLAEELDALMFGRDRQPAAILPRLLPPEGDGDSAGSRAKRVHTTQ